MHGAHDLLTRWPALDVAAKRARLLSSFQLSATSLQRAMSANLAAATRAAAGLGRRDPSIWSEDARVRLKIADRLGWMTSPAMMVDALSRLDTLRSSIKADSLTDIVLLGMGGSSLAPEVLRAIGGVGPGYPRFHVVDSTDPAAIRAAMTPPRDTLYVLASKSGTTIEPNALAAHFRDQLKQGGIHNWADHFVAITDEGTQLARRARHEHFRDLFINPADIGGRYSALSFFGLVPAALMGQDVAGLLGWGLALLSTFETVESSGVENVDPATTLGLAMGAAALSGRDKLTLVLPRELEPFGLWIEQLIAESTGKNGKGVVPVAGEEIGQPSEYGADRFFVQMTMQGAGTAGTANELVEQLRSNNPFAEIKLAEPMALGAEFVRWEVATAIAGALLQINPFDEPNVQQAKDKTKALLDRYVSSQSLQRPRTDRALDDGTTLTLSTAARTQLAGNGPHGILKLIRDGDYFALLAYVGPDEELEKELHALRMSVRDRARTATMLGYGPRYLHSTGQLHKGGPNTGVFVLISATPLQDISIPDEPFSFGTLELAQAVGDFASLDAAGRRVLHVHLPAPDPRLVRNVAETLLNAVDPRT